MWRILVVDDEPEIRGVLEEYLGALGHTVDCVSSGREAMECVQQSPEPYDIALVDWHMPGITGRDVLEGIASLSPTTRAIVITGHIGEKVGKGHLAGLVTRVCHKPFALRTLKNELDALMAGATAPATVP